MSIKSKKRRNAAWRAKLADAAGLRRLSLLEPGGLMAADPNMMRKIGSPVIPGDGFLDVLNCGAGHLTFRYDKGKPEEAEKGWVRAMVAANNRKFGDTMEETTDEYVPIRKAAKMVHRSREKVRDLVERRLVPARQTGKSRQGSPWLSVHLEKLRQALANEEAYVPSAPLQMSHRRSCRTETSKLHPSAAAI